VLVELDSRTVLAAKDPHLVLPAASLTKVVAIHAAADAGRVGELDLDAAFSPPPETWAENQPAGSSLMFLRGNQVLTVWQLLEGLAISSGNDAALALALQVDGSVDAFAARMNAVVRRAGLLSTEFVEPSGLNPFNLTTPYEYAAFVLTHIVQFPGFLMRLYSRESYTYPQQHNMLLPEAGPAVTQKNRNLLIGTYEGADGIKTGFIDESGYHLAATAERDGRRLVAVVMGISASTHAEGGRLRAQDAAALLDYGFAEFDLLRFAPPEAGEVRTYKAENRTARPYRPAELPVSVPAGAGARLVGRTERLEEVIAPVPEGAQIGTVTLLLDGVVLGDAAVTMPEVREGGFLRRWWDAVLLFFASLFGDEAPARGETLAVART
jgi:D-alanyl-D-alanine carboxypeptidase (penicillin-binding protein 5/6)